MRAVVPALMLAAVSQLQPAPDASRVLADMRQALGGDAAIAALHTFSVSGSEQRSMPGGPTFGVGIEWFCELPDRFIRVRRSSTPWGDDINEDGFNAGQWIHRRDSPMPGPDRRPKSAAEEAALEERTVRDLHHEFSRLTVAMIGIPALDPLDASYATAQTVDGRHCDVLALKSSDGYEARLWIDTASHLPFAIAWMGKPIVTMTTSSIVAVPVGPGQSPRSFTPPPPPASAFPSGDPTAGMPDVLHQVRFEDFKTEDGFTWPHRFVEKVGDRVWTTTKLGKYKLNQKIDPKKFAPK